MPRMLLSSTNEEYEVSDEAAELSCTLNGAPDARPMPTPLTNEVLTRVCQLLNDIASADLLNGVADGAALLYNGIRPHDDDFKERAAGLVAHLNIYQVGQLLGDLKWFDCALPASILVQRTAALLRACNDADELRTLLGAPDDLSAADKVSALREPLLTPAPPASEAAEDVRPRSIGRSVSFAMDAGVPDEGNLMACLAS
eukprot:6452234-Prymnesium_polylepis.1